jgi:pilus assembly protein Flp/PilA
MKNIGTSIVRFLKEEDGPTAVEYAVLLMCIILVCIVAIRSIGTTTKGNFEKTPNAKW